MRPQTTTCTLLPRLAWLSLPPAVKRKTTRRAPLHSQEKHCATLPYSPAAVCILNKKRSTTSPSGLSFFLNTSASANVCWQTLVMLCESSERGLECCHSKRSVSPKLLWSPASAAPSL